MHAPLHVGRYILYDAIAAGGMATVHIGRLLGEAGFSRTVAIKRLHPHLAKEPALVDSLLDEAHLAARVRHPNVLAAYDIVRAKDELLLVMEYVAGESLARLLDVARADDLPVPRANVVAILRDVLHGLNAAHEARRETGVPLHIVHRDVSPQNILVGTDGIGRVIDFGVAKAVGRRHSTQDGRVKGKLAYMAPEQLRGGHVDRRTDIFAAGIVLWEALTGQRLFGADTEALTITNVLERPIPRPRTLAPHVSGALEAVVMRALEREPSKRYSSARQMALELEAAESAASPAEVEAWVRELASDALQERARRVEAIELETSRASPPRAPPSGVPVASSGPSSPLRRRWIGGATLAALVLAGAASVAVISTRPVSTRPAPDTALDTDLSSAPAPTSSGAPDVPSSSASPAAVVETVEAGAAMAGAAMAGAATKAAGRATPPKASPSREPSGRARKGVRPEVTEYVDRDGVTHFCRPPHCPK